MSAISYKPFPVITIEGDPRECGVQHGERAAERVAPVGGTEAPRHPGAGGRHRGRSGRRDDPRAGHVPRVDQHQWAFRTMQGTERAGKISHRPSMAATALGG